MTRAERLRACISSVEIILDDLRQLNLPNVKSLAHKLKFNLEQIESYERNIESSTIRREKA